MARLRRTRYLAFTCQDESLPDFPALLRGTAKRAPFRRTYAISVLRGKAFAVTAHESPHLLLSLPSDRWVDSDSVDGDAAAPFAQLGLVVTDDDDEELAELASPRSRARGGAMESLQRPGLLPDQVA